jgi:hypothetical protein
LCPARLVAMKPFLARYYSDSFDAASAMHA